MNEMNEEPVAACLKKLYALRPELSDFLTTLVRTAELYEVEGSSRTLVLSLRQEVKKVWVCLEQLQSALNDLSDPLWKAEIELRSKK